MSCPSDESFSARFENDKLVVEKCEETFTEISSHFNGSIIRRHVGAVYSVFPRTETWGFALKNDTLNRYA